MPRPLLISDGPDTVHNVDWEYAGTIANATAAAQIVPAGGAGTRHYISSLVVNAYQNMWVKAQCTTASVEIGNFHCASAGVPVMMSFPRGLELKMGLDNTDIDLLSDVSGTIGYTVRGFYTK